MSDFSERDKELLAKFGMTEQQVEDDAERMESETADHGITGPVYYGSHFIPNCAMIRWVASPLRCP